MRETMTSKQLLSVFRTLDYVMAPDERLMWACSDSTGIDTRQDLSPVRLTRAIRDEGLTPAPSHCRFGRCSRFQGAEQRDLAHGGGS